MKVVLLLVVPLLASAVGAQDSFRDCDDCPEMVIVPPGAVTIGSHPDTMGRRDRERPRQQARITRAFAMARTEVTLGQYRAFVLNLTSLNSITTPS